VFATPLLLALIAIEGADLVFALDSIPAVLAVTKDTFLIYTSNIFALLGVRSLYFLLAGGVQRLRYIRTGLGIILLFVAAKMLLGDSVEIRPAMSLAVIASILIGSIAASRLLPGSVTDEPLTTLSKDAENGVAPTRQAL
jgi:tellurite resistance protein TerC